MVAEHIFLLIRVSLSKHQSNNLHWVYLEHLKDCLLKTMRTEELSNHFTHNLIVTNILFSIAFYNGAGK